MKLVVAWIFITGWWTALAFFYTLHKEEFLAGAMGLYAAFLSGYIAYLLYRGIEVSKVVKEAIDLLRESIEKDEAQKFY